MRGLNAGRCCALLCIAMLAAGCKDAPAPPSHEEIIQQDLALILRSQNLPCAKVDSFTASARLDYRVECSGGQAYRITVSQEGITSAEAHP